MGLLRKIIGFKLNGLKIRYLSGVKSALVNLILQFLDSKGPYNVVENHGPALLGEGQIFVLRLKKRFWILTRNLYYSFLRKKTG